MYWTHDYPGLPGPPDPNNDSTRIFSSPVVVDGRGHRRRRRRRPAEVRRLRGRGQPRHRQARSGSSRPTCAAPGSTQKLYDSCGSVWSSGTVLPDLGLVVFGTADCNFGGSAPYADSVIALRIADGTLAWKYHPLGHAPVCDDDFGASANAGLTAGGKTSFLGEGSKNGTYYSLNPRTGRVALVHQRGLRRYVRRVHRDHRLRRLSGAGRNGARRLPPDLTRDLAGLRPLRPPRRVEPEPCRSRLRRGHGSGALAGRQHGVVLGHHGGRRHDVQRPRPGRQGDPGARRGRPGACWRRSPCDQLQLVRHRHRGRRRSSSASGTTASATSSGIEVLTPGGAPPVVPGGG